MSIATLRHTPIRRKLLTLALAAGLAFFTVSVLFVLSWRDLEKVSSRVSSTYIPTLRDGSAALVSVSSLGTELFRYVNQIEPSAYRVGDALAGARAALQRIAGSDIPPEIRANIESLLPQVAAQEAGLHRLTAHVERDNVLGIGEEHTRMAAEAGLMLRGVERINGQLLDSIVQENHASARQSQQRAAVVAALSLICIVAALLYMIMVRRDLEAGLAGLREATRRYATGESGSIAPLDRRDEIGQLSHYLDQTERELADQRRRLELVVRAASVGIIDWDGATRKGWYSERLREMLGYTADADLSTWVFFDAVHPQDSPALRAALVATLKGEAGTDTLDSEYRMRCVDGRYLWVRGTGLALRGADGRTSRFLTSITDISARRAQEEALRDQAKLTRDLIDANPNPVYLKDEQRRFVEINAAYAQLTGLTREQCLGRTVLEIYPPDRAETYDRQDRELLERGEGSNTIEVPGAAPVGSVQISDQEALATQFLMSKSVLKRADGTVRGLVGALTDITPLKKVEAELRASREEALQAARAKAAFLAAMSHEIRTPLNGVLGMAGLLADTVLTEEQHEYVDTIRVSGDALLSVINDILDFSKIESGRMDVENTPFEPMRAVEEALEILGERARGKRLELAADAEDSVPAWVVGDFARLRQVLVNLVGNAVKFTERGEVVVRLRAPRAGSLEIEVSDTGVGIARDRLAHLFEAFTQADASTTRRYGGTGLGLAISKRLVELMGGDLRADSEPGRGSTFVFNVSVTACEAPSAAATAEPVELAGRRILIVDDNATNLRILRRQLERWGAVPVAAAAGQAALALLESERGFDAALLDYHMPDMDGVMLARRIKAQAKSLPLLLLSSSMYRRAEEAEAGLFVVQLLKPVRQQQLREALVSALGGAGPMRKGRELRAAARARPPAQLRVLVVDDVDANCRLAQALLRKFGHLSEVATSGLEAVDMAASGRFDVVLMDVQMPDIDGMDATQRIRERLGAASPRIIAVTANAMPGDRERCLAAGMDDYLSKPIQHRALRAAIESPRGAQSAAARTAGRAAAPAPADAIDWRRIESLDPFDVDGSMVAGAIASFLADAPGRIRALHEAQAAGDAAGLVAAAHALKGAAANIGAAQIQVLSQAIESAAREGHLEDARQPAAALEKALAEARVALAEGRPSRGS